MNNKRRGSDFERRVKKELEKHGYLVIKSGGSLGAFDLVAIKLGMRPLGVQCKVRHPLISSDEWNELFEQSLEYDMIPILAYRDQKAPYGLFICELTSRRTKRSRHWPMNDFLL